MNTKSNNLHLQNTPLQSLIEKIPDILQFRTLENGFISFHNRIFTWTGLNDKGYIQMPPQVLARFGVNPGDKILAGRGSGLALAFIRQGTIIKEGQNHSELKLFT